MNEPRKSCIVTASESDSSSSVGNLCRRAARLTRNLPAMSRPEEAIGLILAWLGTVFCWWKVLTVEERVVEQGKASTVVFTKEGGQLYNRNNSIRETFHISNILLDWTIWLQWGLCIPVMPCYTLICKLALTKWITRIETTNYWNMAWD